VEALDRLRDPVLLPEALKAAEEIRQYGPLITLLPLADPDRIADLVVRGTGSGRMAILTALDRIAPEAATFAGGKLLSAVTACAFAPERELRHEAVGLLPRFGQMALPALGRVLLDDDRIVATHACTLLRPINDVVWLPYAARALDEHPEDRYALARLVASLEHQDVDRVIAGLLDDESDVVRLVAVQALASGGRWSDPSRLRTLSTHRHAGVRSSAATSRGSFGAGR
jgi:HEAT repeat protein